MYCGIIHVYAVYVLYVHVCGTLCVGFMCVCGMYVHVHVMCSCVHVCGVCLYVCIVLCVWCMYVDNG